MPPSVKEQDVSPELQEAMYTYMGKHNATSDARLHDVTYLTQLVYIPARITFVLPLSCPYNLCLAFVFGHRQGYK